MLNQCRCQDDQNLEKESLQKRRKIEKEKKEVTKEKGNKTLFTKRINEQAQEQKLHPVKTKLRKSTKQLTIPSQTLFVKKKTKDPQLITKNKQKDITG